MQASRLHGAAGMAAPQNSKVILGQPHSGIDRPGVVKSLASNSHRQRGAAMAGARKLTGGETASKTITFGVVGTGDPRIDAASRQRCGQHRPDGRRRGGRQRAHARRHARRTSSGTPCWSTARSRPTSWRGQFRDAGVDAVDLRARHLGLPATHADEPAGPPARRHAA